MADDDVTEDQTEDDASTEDADAEDTEDWTPPTKEEVTRLRNTAQARKVERDQARRELRDAKAAAAGTGDGAGTGADEDAGPNWRDTAVRNSAASALQAAGFSGSAKQAKKLARLLDLDGIEPDASGDFDLTDEVDELKDEFPQLFAAPTSDPARPPRRTTADRGRQGATPDPDKTTSRLLKQAGYR